MTEFNFDDEEVMERFRENALKELSKKFIIESYNKDENGVIRNNLFLENCWLEEKNKNDSLENIESIILLLENNSYYKFTGYHVTHLLENYRLNTDYVEEKGFMASLFGFSKRKIENKNKYNFYIYTKDFIYYTDCNVKKNGDYFTIIPR